MKGYYKRFNQDLYDKHDNLAKTKLIEFLKKRNHSILNSEENYGVDVVSIIGKTTHYSEAEVKVGWKDNWPTTWKEIRIPERKQRLLDKYGNNLNFFVFRNDLKQVWRISGKLLTTNSLRNAWGRNINPNELFFHIPYEKAELYDVE